VINSCSRTRDQHEGAQSSRAQDLLAKDVGVAAVLREFTKDVQIDPSQGQRPLSAGW